MKDAFVFAAAYGFHFRTKEKLKKKKGTIPLSAFSDAEKWLLMSIAIADQNSLDILFNVKQVYEIAQEYANGGITILRNAVMSGQPGDPYKRIEAEIKNILPQPTE
jgi:dnd system-associated protein 4